MRKQQLNPAFRFQCLNDLICGKVENHEYAVCAFMYLFSAYSRSVQMTVMYLLYVLSLIVFESSEICLNKGIVLSDGKIIIIYDSCVQMDEGTWRKFRLFLFAGLFV